MVGESAVNQTKALDTSKLGDSTYGDYGEKLGG